MPLPDPDDLAAIAARARKLAERFSLPLRDQQWRGASGEFAGSGVGSSIDFQDHRAYVPGDDPRHINWQAYARSGNYSLKLYREEVRPIVELVCDVSDSMFADPEKAARVAELAQFVIASAEKSGAGLSVCLVKGPRWQAVPRDSLGGARWIEDAAKLPGTTASAVPQLGSIPLRRKSLRVFLSDLLFPSNPEPLLRVLGQGQGRVLVLAPFAAAEADPDWSGNCEFVDTESGVRQQRRVDKGLMRRYRAAYLDHFAQWRGAAQRFRFPFARVPSDLPFGNALQHEALASRAIVLA